MEIGERFALQHPHSLLLSPVAWGHYPFHSWFPPLDLDLQPAGSEMDNRLAIRIRFNFQNVHPLSVLRRNVAGDLPVGMTFSNDTGQRICLFNVVHWRCR